MALYRSIGYIGVKEKAVWVTSGGFYGDFPLWNRFYLRAAAYLKGVNAMRANRGQQSLFHAEAKINYRLKSQ